MAGQQSTPETERGPLSPATAIYAAAAVIAYFAIILAFLSDPTVTRVFFLRQDGFAGAAMVAALLAVAVMLRRPPALRLPACAPSARMMTIAATLLALALWAGTYAIMGNYPLSRDELMAGFDAAIFAGGRLAQPVAEEWRLYALALVPDFALETSGQTALVSSYMPGNAMMRAAMPGAAAQALLNPLLAALGLVAIWDCARRLFADCPQAVWAVLAAYVLSAQVLANAMTSYAMTGHLAFNAIWLALFLRDRAWSHAAAIAVGLWAMGLHQVVFHPLFAGPILLTLLPQRRWRLFAVYALCYAVGLVGWTIYPSLALASVGASAAAGAGGGGLASFLTERVLPLLRIDGYAVPLMMYNLLRFLAWNAAFLLPLLVLAIPAAKRREALPLALFGSVAATFAALFLLLPYQGHGWGYRYWHPVLPALFLLCGYGYREWARRGDKGAGFAVAALSIATIPVAAFLLVQAHRFIAPYAALSDRIGRQAAALVILETDPPGSAVDQVRNAADLANRPLIFASHRLDMASAKVLCGEGSVTFLRKHSFALVPFGVAASDPGPAYDKLEEWLRAQPCWREPRP